MEARLEMDDHPYKAAWRTRDLQAWADALAPDVVMYSPILMSPFNGRDAAIELFEVLFGAIGKLKLTHELSAGDTHVFFWRADIGPDTIEGTDLLRFNETGKIAEIRVLIRPLVDIGKFAAAIGPPLAAKRGFGRGPLTRALILPLKAILAMADAISTRLVQTH